ncbi:prepilin-type N-terminal cleavage/methylation domain-containing protein [Haloimpatiens lingqiaonensis]|uniref:prepilin-type N-terminal cleavage/methylation domain-containing protein n=1 Tax=Haloimpatiens lingqiaonensis TaxID=1380675 RepID=UPI0010FF35DA|nr:prepilin-type N-terminal cleavage/methylation domain-containing protein [Haloimpatiens lingqiaonensis]
MEITTNLKKSKKKGFTLIELIIVIAIIGIIALIAIPKFGNAQKDAKIKADIASAKTIADVTSVLVTKGDITVPTTTDLEISKTATDDAEKIVKELQSVPELKVAKDKKFKVKIDKDGNVTVFADTVELYPNPATSYGK